MVSVSRRFGTRGRRGGGWDGDSLVLPPQVTLVSWWAADYGVTLGSGSDISTVADRGPSGATLAKTDDGALTAFPQLSMTGKGGKPVMAFSGTTAPLRGVFAAASWAASWSGTFAVAAKITSGTDGALADFETALVTNQGCAIFREAGNLKWRRAITDVSSSDSSTSWRVIVGTGTTSAGDMRVNGVSAGTSGAATHNDLNNVQLGALFGAVFPLNGEIGEVLCYSSVLSGTDLSALESYMSTRWV